MDTSGSDTNKTGILFLIILSKRELSLEGMETVGRIGLLSNDEVQECLKDIDTFLIDVNNWDDPSHLDSMYYEMVIGSDGSINNSTVVGIPQTFGIFKEQKVVPLQSMFGSRPPYKNTLDMFFNVAPKWFVDKYEQKNREWEKIHKM